MAKYIVTYEETLAKTFIIEADSAIDAEDLVRDAIKREDIVLDSSDFVCGDVVNVEESCGQDEWWYETI